MIDPATWSWNDAGCQGRPWKEAVIYELHVGTYTPQGTFRAAIEKLDQEGRKALQEKMEAAHYPPVDKLPTAAARQVIKWASEIAQAS